MRYDDYLNSAHWQEFKRVYRATHEAQCFICGRYTSQCGNKLEIHHITYANVGKETENDVRLLCDDCHRLVHYSVKEAIPVVKELRLLYNVGQLTAFEFVFQNEKLIFDMLKRFCIYRTNGRDTAVANMLRKTLSWYSKEPRTEPYSRARAEAMLRVERGNASKTEYNKWYLEQKALNPQIKISWSKPNE